jgi:acyl-CoA thioester hydrolase
MLYLETEYRVIYGDTDKMGVVYYANYLRFFEIGRTELLRSWHLPYSQLEAEEGFWLPVSEVQCKYMAPAEYDDLIIIRAGLDPEVKAGLKIDYTIASYDRETLHATGYTMHAFLNRQGKVVRPPKIIRELIKQQSATLPGPQKT